MTNMVYGCPISRPLNIMKRPRYYNESYSEGQKHPVEIPLLPVTDSPNVRHAVMPFKAGSSILYVNGVRYWNNDDYFELAGGRGFTMDGLEASDEVVLMALHDE